MKTLEKNTLHNKTYRPETSISLNQTSAQPQFYFLFPDTPVLKQLRTPHPDLKNKQTKTLYQDSQRLSSCHLRHVLPVLHNRKLQVEYHIQIRL